MLLSVVVPCFDEEPVIVETHRRLTSVLAGLKELEFEIIYVDDGSKDETPKILESLQMEDERVRVLRLSRNFGHQIAVTAGLENSSGNAVVIIDADLQDPPEVISEMIKRWREGYEVAYGQRVEREGETGFKLWSAKAYYRLINRISETKMPLDTGDFRLMDRKVVDSLLAMPERDRFLRGMVSWVGFRQVAVPYQRARRHAGESKYPILKMIRFATDGIVSFSIAPLKIAIWTGFFAIWLAIIGIIVAVVVRLMDKNLNRGWASLFVAVLFMGGIQLVSLGIIGEYLGRIYTEVKRRPLYIIQERLGFEAKKGTDVRVEREESARG
ncbi:MAG: glycosyltransferase [Acidobacteria bacterium]|nr:MAG: glycosyltransferase [Acidobacteriota bacterium]